MKCLTIRHFDSYAVQISAAPINGISPAEFDYHLLPAWKGRSIDLVTPHTYTYLRLCEFQDEWNGSVQFSWGVNAVQAVSS